MKTYVSIVTLAVWASMAKAGQLISTYNLISPSSQVAFPQTYSSSSYGLVHPQYFSSIKPQEQILAHPAVVATSYEESSVPRSLKKSDHFYSNPYVASALAKESLTFNKETIIYDRPTENIDRNEIVKLINNLKRAHHEAK